MINLKLIEPVSKLLNTTLGLFKDTKGKLSSKRTISGIIVITASTSIAQHGITISSLVLTALGVLPVIFSVFEKNKCNCDGGGEK
tara:strand:+ start:336 stop:590 length:255 start_codon:yes stop_codon:yes gene_type:complete